MSKTEVKICRSQYYFTFIHANNWEKYNPASGLFIFEYETSIKDINEVINNNL